eukprot:TRINITY_DN14533_c0_g1_i1.p1 TRINITY_DN14533_c0_g1~~TRINITY_DN14533_c0_g1_i1.p1  ORF type:complete len:320 (-),score=89.82 TRINITY_DN14533_c0_g1_i1:158-1117(-)
MLVYFAAAPVVVVAVLVYKLATWSIGGKVDINSDGKAVFVTGAASGLGKAIVELLLEKGCFVFAADINLSALERLWGGNANVRVLKVDVTKQADVDAARRVVDQAGRGLYGVVNSAGIGIYPGGALNVARSVLEWDIDSQVRPVIDINLLGTMRVNSAFFEPIVQSKGCVVNIASLAGRVASAGLGAYVASKFGVAGYSGTIRKELAHYGTRVLCIEPSWIRTNMTEGLTSLRTFDKSQTKLPLAFEAVERLIARTGSWDPSKWATPEMVADVAYRGLFSSKISNPHVVVDQPGGKAVFTLWSFMPHAWVDAMLAFASR